jgi:hypothetical protein
LRQLNGKVVANAQKRSNCSRFPSSPQACRRRRLDQVFIATASAGVATAIPLVLVFGHRSGRIPVFARLGGVAQRVSGMRDWPALPGTVLIISLTVAGFGMYWDVGTHLDNGRDPGPLANPAQRQAEPARSRRSRPRGSSRGRSSSASSRRTSRRS